MPDESQKIQMPPSAQPSTTAEPIIRVMPAEFRGGKSPMTAAVVPPKPAPVPPAPKPEPPKPPAPPPVPVKVIPPPGGKVPQKKKRLISPALLIVGLLFLAVLGVGAYFVLSSVPPEEPPVTTPEPEVPEPTVEPPEPEIPEPEVPTEPVPGTDGDSDGLSNIEEILYGADPRNPDTDGDTYLDGNEVFHLYNPRGDAPGLLTDAGFARAFGSEEVSFTIVFPSRWTVQLVGGETEGVMFRAPTSEFIQVLVQPKDPALTIREWYLAQSPDAEEAELETVTTRQGYSGITSPDKMTTYLDLEDRVYVVSYNLGDTGTIDFLTTYQMMLNSLVVIE